jgi:hypothetical protein
MTKGKNEDTSKTKSTTLKTVVFLYFKSSPTKPDRNPFLGE